MTQVLIDRATLEQLVRMLEQCLDDAIQVQCDLEQGYSKSLALAQMVQVELSKEALTAGRAALGNAEPPEWQPIETAPKDGRPILLFGDCRVTSGHWSAPSETPRIIYQDGFAPDTEWDEWEPYWASWDGGFTEEHPPTHWMPLPAAPKEQQ